MTGPAPQVVFEHELNTGLADLVAKPILLTVRRAAHPEFSVVDRPHPPQDVGGQISVEIGTHRALSHPHARELVRALTKEHQEVLAHVMSDRNVVIVAVGRIRECPDHVGDLHQVSGPVDLNGNFGEHL